jgi:hypothetical protein
MTDHVAGGPKKYPISSTKKKALDEMCAAWIAQDMRPIAIVEGTGFRKFIESLDPRYQLPTRRTITKTIIPRITVAERKKLSEKLH